MTHELFEELDAFNPRWQAAYRTVAVAATAAGVSSLYLDWLRTPQGKLHEAIMADVADTIAQNEAECKLRARARELT